MTQSFNNPPLVEIVAELRWTSSSTTVPSQTQVVAAPGVPVPNVEFFNASKLDEFFMRLGGVLYGLEFRRAERLIPANFPLISGQPIFRYKKQDNPSVMFQAGNGLFTVNGLPPYKSWTEFSQVVSSGVAALIEARSEQESSESFSSVSLRYIDAFDESLTKGLSATEFIKNILGFSVQFPAAISRVVDESKDIKTSIQLQIPMPDGLSMGIKIAEAMVKGIRSVLLDTTVTASGDCAPTIEAVMHKLNSAHDVIHETFISMTSKIHSDMKPA